MALPKNIGVTSPRASRPLSSASPAASSERDVVFELLHALVFDRLARGRGASRLMHVHRRDLGAVRDELEEEDLLQEAVIDAAELAARR